VGQGGLSAPPHPLHWGPTRPPDPQRQALAALDPAPHPVMRCLLTSATHRAPWGRPSPGGLARRWCGPVGPGVPRTLLCRLRARRGWPGVAGWWWG